MHRSTQKLGLLAGVLPPLLMAWPKYKSPATPHQDKELQNFKDISCAAFLIPDNKMI